jgi:5-methylcytosine-specific restriction enzyme A
MAWSGGREGKRSLSKRPTWSAKDRAEIFRDNGGVCHICTRKIAPGEAWEVEHPKARGLGGSDKKADMRPAHVDCHKPKTANDIRIMRKADRQMKKGLGLKKPSRLPGSRSGKWKKKINGEVVAR